MSTKKNIQFLKKDYKAGFHKFSTIGDGSSNIPLDSLVNSNIIDILSIRGSNVGIGIMNPLVSLDTNRTDAYKLPAGSANQRPTGVKGYIRYNTDTNQFEGFGAGNSWGSLEGVKSTDQYTYITAELSPGNNDSNLRFYTSATQQAIINPQGNLGIGTDSPLYKLQVVGSAYVSETLTASNLVIFGSSTILNTITSNTEQIVITNDGTGPALKVTQTGNNSVAEFYDNESGIALYIGNNGNIGIGTTDVSLGRLVVAGNIVPATCNIYDLGTSNYRFRDIYLSGNTIDFDNVGQIGTSNQAIVLRINNIEKLRVEDNKLQIEGNIRGNSLSLGNATMSYSNDGNLILNSGEFYLGQRKFNYNSNTEKIEINGQTVGPAGIETQYGRYRLDKFQLQKAAATNQWSSVAWAEELGIFAAVAKSGTGTRVMISTNGVTWVTCTSAADNTWNSITWADTLGLFVAVASSGTGNRIMTSPDGITWTTRTNPVDNDWSCVIWAKELGLLVAVSTNGSSNRAMTSPDGINWTTRTTDLNAAWSSVTWAKSLGLLIAVNTNANDLRVMTSPDGINWTRRNAPNNTWNSVTWSEELGVAIAVASGGSGNRIMASTDGINWVIRPSPADNSWINVTWVSDIGLFIAVASSGTGNRIMTSPDSITWTLSRSAYDYAWSGITWSASLNMIIVVSTDGTGIMSAKSSYISSTWSLSGSWTTQSITTNNQWDSIAWSPTLNLLAAVSKSGTGNRIMTSVDCVTWTTRTSPTDNDWTSIIWVTSLNKFIVVASSGTGNRVMTSSDGITWATQSSAVDNNWTSLTWSSKNTLLVAVASSGTGNRIMTSPDGITWTSRTSPTDNNWTSVTWISELSQFVAVASSGTGNRVMTSSNGITWVTRTSAADNDWSSIAWSKEYNIMTAVATTGTGTRVMTSFDGITWVTQTSAADNNWQSIIWSSELNLFIAVGSSGTGNRIMTSQNGVSWVTITSPADISWNAIAWAPEIKKAVAVATDGTGNGVMTSTYVITSTTVAPLVRYSQFGTWTARAAIATVTWLNVIWIKELGLFVAAGNGGDLTNRIMTSPNGLTWTSRTTNDNNWNSLAWSKELGLIVAVASSGTGNRVMTSPDAITWTTRTSAANNGWTSVTWAADLGLFVAVANSGSGNRVMTSPNGITWTTRTSAIDNNWTSITWAPELGLLVAVSNSSASGSLNRIMTSPNGITWTSRSTPVDNTWTSITWAPEVGLLAAIANSGTGNRIMTSPNGTTWTSRATPTTPAENNWQSIIWAKELYSFVAISDSTNTSRVLVSSDGVTWTTVSASSESGGTNNWRSVTWSPEVGRFVSVATALTLRVQTLDYLINNITNAKDLSLGLAFDNKDRLRMNYDGNIGIGIRNPLEKLHVSGNIYSTGQFYASLSDSVSAPVYSFKDNSNTGMSKPATNTIALSTNGLERMRIDTNGNVGIGTTSTVAKLHIVQETTGTSFRVDDVANDITPFIINDGGNVGIGTNIPLAQLHIVELGTNPILRIDDIANDTTPFIVTSEGNIGIGTNNPIVGLAINKTDAILIPKGTTAQRPSGVQGYIRYNTDIGQFEAYGSSNSWGVLGSGGDGAALAALTVSATGDSNLLTVAAHLVPSSNEVYDLGSSNLRFRDLWLSGNTLNIGDKTIKVNAITGDVEISAAIKADDGLKVGNTTVINGSGQLDASRITTGTFGTAQIPSLDASKITSGTIDAAQIPSLDASRITTGTFGTAQIPSLDASKITSGTIDAAQIPSLDASKITSGTIDAARISSISGSVVGSATASLTPGSVGTYVFGQHKISGTSGAFSLGTSISGTNIAAACVYVTGTTTQWARDTPTDQHNSGVALAGSYNACGNWPGVTSGVSRAGLSIFLRIA